MGEATAENGAMQVYNADEAGTQLAVKHAAPVPPTERKQRLGKAPGEVFDPACPLKKP